MVTIRVFKSHVKLCSDSLVFGFGQKSVHFQHITKEELVFLVL